MRSLLLRGLNSRFAKPAVFALALLPLCWLFGAAALNALGANPAQALERASGLWTLRLLCLVLLVTPLRTVANLPQLARLRRMLGLFVFFYAVLHLLAYAWFDMGLDLGDIARDIPKRPFILVGFCAVLLLTLLAATSFNRAIKLLGGARWKRLHQAVYLVAALAVLHFYWMRAGKHDFASVILYGAILGLLLAWRGLKFINKKGFKAASALNS